MFLLFPSVFLGFPPLESHFSPVLVGGGNAQLMVLALLRGTRVALIIVASIFAIGLLLMQPSGSGPRSVVHPS